MPQSEFALDLHQTELEALLELGRLHAAEPGDVLLRQGEPGDRVVVVIDGRVKVDATTRAGSTAVLGFRGPGAMLGELSVVDDAPRNATVTAMEDVVYLVVPASAFRRHLQENPGIALALISHLSARLRDSDRKRAEHVAGDTAVRVAARLVELADHYGVHEDGGVRIEMPLSQHELAGWAGSSLEAVARVLRTMRTAGWLATARREVTVCDLPALRRLAAVSDAAVAHVDHA